MYHSIISDLSELASYLLTRTVTHIHKRLLFILIPYILRLILISQYDILAVYAWSWSGRGEGVIPGGSRLTGPHVERSSAANADGDRCPNGNAEKMPSGCEKGGRDGNSVGAGGAMDGDWLAARGDVFGESGLHSFAEVSWP